MTLWLDAQLPPALAPWFQQNLDVACFSLKHLDLDKSLDEEIFALAKKKNIVLVTKDSDFIQLLDQYGPPPQIVHIRLGNSTNAFLKDFFLTNWSSIQSFLNQGIGLVEVGLRTSG